MTELRWLETDQGDWERFAGLVTRFGREAIPTEREVDVAGLQAEALQAASGRTVHPLLALVDGEPAGAAQVIVDELRGPSAWVKYLYVRPEDRGRGVGSRLLGATLERARARGCRRLRTMSLAKDAAGQRFAERHAASPGLGIDQSRCPIGALDPVRLMEWVERATQRAGGYSLVAFDGVCPDEHLSAFAAAIPIMNTAPRAPGTEDVAPSPEEVRLRMSAHVQQGNEPWTICARDDGTGRFVGYTELSFSRRRPWEASQGDTGVDVAHRGLGIGRWLKAQNALRLLAERPEVEYIETWNAGTNAPMVSINRAMGFRTVAAWQEWQLPV